MSVAPDGSPVNLYLALPGAEEAALIDAAVPDGAEILELGCGAGRVTRPLAGLGHRVTGIDNSVDMLATLEDVDGVETVQAELLTLDLAPRVWPVVVLASYFMNDEAAGEFLATAERHLAADGQLIVERYAPGWVDSAVDSSTERCGVVLRLTEVEHPQPGAISATMVYEVGVQVYRQPFTAHEVDDRRLDELAQAAGLSVDRFLDADRCWAALSPAL